MSDIATLGIAIDTTDVSRGAAELDKLTAAAQRSQTRADAMGESIRRQNSSMVQVQAATSQAAAAIDKTSAAYKKLDDEVAQVILSSNKVAAAQAQLGKSQAILSQGLEAGIISQKTYQQGLADLAAKFAPTAEGAAKATVSTSFLTREIHALGDEIASGRIRQAEGTFVNLSTRLLALGPAALIASGAVIGVAAAVGLLIARQEELDRAIVKIQVGFAATGNAGLLSAKQIKTYIEALALLPGVSRDAAEKSVTELSRVPYITGPLFDETAKHLADFAALLGTDVPKAAATLAKAFENPKDAADQLDKQFNLLTGNQRLLIESYTEHGDKASALGILLKALEDRSKGLAETGLTPLQKASNDVVNAWDHLLKSFGESTTISSAIEKIASLIKAVADLFTFIENHKAAIGAFFSNLPGVSQVRAVAALIPSASSTAGGGNSVSGRLLGPDGQPLYAASAAATAGVGGTTATTSQQGQDPALRALIDRNPGVSQASRVKQETQDLKAFQEQLKSTNLSQAERAAILDKIALIQEKITKQGPKAAEIPLGLNVDKAQLEAALKVIEVAQAAEKATYDERQKYIDFYHKMGVTTEAEYNRQTDDLENQRIASLQASFAKEVAAVKADQDQKRAQLTAGGKALPQRDQDSLNSAILQDEKQLVELKGKEAALTEKIAADEKFRATAAPLIEAQKQYNEVLKQTQEISSSLSVTQQRNALEVELGQKTQQEAMLSNAAATEAAISKDRDQLAILMQIQATSPYAEGSVQAIALQNAIDGLNIKLLQMQANLDPIGKQLNQAFNQDLVTFFDKFGSGGIKTFKDLKDAASSFFGSIASQIAHQANQNLADSLLKSLNLKTNEQSGGTGGLGGLISRALGNSKPSTTTPTSDSSATSSSASTAADASSAVTGATTDAANDPMGAFIKNLDTANTGLSSLSSGGIAGMAKNAYSFITKQILGTTTEATATSATASATVALSALAEAAYAAASGLSAGGGGSLINANVTDDALALFHSGGIVGQASATRQVRYTDADVANAPRFHGGGISGLDHQTEQLAVLQKGEEVITASDPRHRNNGGAQEVSSFHTGGLVGQPTALRLVRFSDADVDNAPRFHGGGVAGLNGYNEPSGMRQAADELPSSDENQHQGNSGRSRRGGTTVVQNFTIQPTESRSSQSQVAARALAGANGALARSR